MPVLFVPHGGGPCFFLNQDGSCPPEWEAMRAYLASVITSLPERPKAILILSAHWLEPRFTVHVGTRPDLLFDYYGFPEHTYRLRFDAPGAPDVAQRAAALLADAGFDTGEEDARGWDHGVFIPMMVAMPAADIPVAQLSLLAPAVRDMDTAAHIRAGEALAPLRDEGVLIVGSGMSFHNMRTFGEAATNPSVRFDAALTEAVTRTDAGARNAALTRWETLDAAHSAHPPGHEEHLLPLMMVAGAAGQDAGVQDLRDTVMGWTVSAFRFG